MGVHGGHLLLVVVVLPSRGVPGHCRVDRSGSAFVPRSADQGERSSILVWRMVVYFIITWSLRNILSCYHSFAWDEARLWNFSVVFSRNEKTVCAIIHAYFTTSSNPFFVLSVHTKCTTWCACVLFYSVCWKISELLVTGGSYMFVLYCNVFCFVSRFFVLLSMSKPATLASRLCVWAGVHQVTMDDLTAVDDQVGYNARYVQCTDV